MDVIVFTDGACSKNGSSSAKAGYGVHFPNKELSDISKPFTKSPITNQRAELYAIYSAIKKITAKLDYATATIYTDSEYSMNCITKWLKSWKKNGWKTANKKEVKNKDIIIKIDKILSEHKNITFKHVRAHTGKTDALSIGNAKADKLATEGATKNDVKVVKSKNKIKITVDDAPIKQMKKSKQKIVVDTSTQTD